MKKHNLVLWLKMYISVFGKIFSYIIPPIVSFGIFSIGRFILAPNYWLFPAIILTIPTVYILIKIDQLFAEYFIITNGIIAVLTKNMEKHSEELP
ncbi:MAG: hypothetical protein U1B80_08750, partial [Anaerolineaceae bacterium]|nr:hypothetical protein [Anaerolineaceae bacterium]